jgi:hypothetical protein
MTRFLILTLLLLAAFSCAQTQTLVDTTGDDTVYIPRDINDVFRVLNKLMPPAERAIVKSYEEDSAVSKLWKSGPPDFFYDWKLGNPPSRIVKYFNNLGISHPYDLTRSIIISYHRYLNNKPINLDKIIRTIKKERESEYKDYLRKLSKDSIDGVYIPIDLKDCFYQLDKILSAKDREKIKLLKNRKETIIYHHELGMWIRNNWGLWGGSRLQKYLLDKNVEHPDAMSSLILEFYYDWLHNNHADWKKWTE